MIGIYDVTLHVLQQVPDPPNQEVPDSLDAFDGLTFIWILAGLIALSGVILVFARWFLDRSSTEKEGDSSFVRSWLALALVAGLLMFGGASLSLKDESIRNLLMGGIVASAASAVAFYFSSKNNDKARADILSFAKGFDTVPDLVGREVHDARKLMSETSLKLAIEPTPHGNDWTVESQTPTHGMTAVTGQRVTAIVVPPAMESTGEFTEDSTADSTENSTPPAPSSTG